MKEYKLYRHPNGIYEAVKQGWSWPAFFFGAIWALAKKIWWLGFGVLSALIAYSVIVSNVVTTMDALMNAGTILYLVMGGLSIYLGFKGNDLRETNLLSRGFHYIETVKAERPGDAIEFCFCGCVRMA